MIKRWKRKSKLDKRRRRRSNKLERDKMKRKQGKLQARK